jgi:IclR family pca regulon transcriptional regulator
MNIDKKDWIAGLDKGLAVLQTFDEHNSRLTATQAAQRCGITRTATRRYLLTLQHLGFVSTDGKLFWLTPKVMRLGQSYLESARLPRIVQPSLQRLAMGTQEISFVAVLDDFELVYIARNGQNRSMNTSFALGARVPCHLTSAGVLLLALLGEETPSQIPSECVPNWRSFELKTGQCLNSSLIWPTEVSQYPCATTKVTFKQP